MESRAPLNIALQARHGAKSPADEAPDTTAVQDVVVLTRALEVDAHRASICMSVGSVGSNRDGVVLENVCVQFAEKLRR